MYRGCPSWKCPLRGAHQKWVQCPNPAGTIGPASRTLAHTHAWSAFYANFNLGSYDRSVTSCRRRQDCTGPSLSGYVVDKTIYWLGFSPVVSSDCLSLFPPALCKLHAICRQIELKFHCCCLFLAEIYLGSSLNVGIPPGKWEFSRGSTEECVT